MPLTAKSTAHEWQVQVADDRKDGNGGTLRVWCEYEDNIDSEDVALDKLENARRSDPAFDFQLVRVTYEVMDA